MYFSTTPAEGNPLATLRQKNPPTKCPFDVLVRFYRTEDFVEMNFAELPVRKINDLATFSGLHESTDGITTDLQARLGQFAEALRYRYVAANPERPAHLDADSVWVSGDYTIIVDWSDVMPTSGEALCYDLIRYLEEEASIFAGRDFTFQI